MQETGGLLDGCRVLDLTDEKGFLCGKILGDLGADVIKVEPPGGAPSRNIAPFYHDIPHPEKSLYWFAYNANKRGITLNIETSDGKEIFKKLAAEADLVIESFPVGHLDKLGLGSQSLAEVNSRIVMVSITPFGQTGPYRDYKAPDIVAVAMGGEMYVTGDPDRAPLRISFPQAFLHGGATPALAAMIARHHCQRTGIGQHADVSVHESLLLFSANVVPFWHILKRKLKRRGVFRTGLAQGSIQRMLWPCKDGYCSYQVMGTPSGAKSNIKLLELMNEEGMAGPLQSFNWDGFDRRTATQETQSFVEEAIAPFMLKHTKQELLEAAVKNGVLLLPVYSPRELLDYTQLKARDFWQDVEHPELGAAITYPGPFVRCSEASCAVRRRAPLIGEHNEEIFKGELGFSKKELVMLKESGII